MHDFGRGVVDRQEEGDKADTEALKRMGGGVFGLSSQLPRSSVSQQGSTGDLRFFWHL